MKPGTPLAERARRLEGPDDQARHSFSAEFKHEAAALLLDQGYSCI